MIFNSTLASANFLATRLSSSRVADFSCRSLRSCVCESRPAGKTSPWDKDLEAHQRIIDLVREAEGEVAEQYVKKAMARFAKTAYDNWENRTSHAG